MTENSNSKAFGVKDLQPNKSHLVPGKTGDGQNADPLTTAMHPRDEIDALIAEGKLARGEKLLIATEKLEPLKSIPFVETDLDLDDHCFAYTDFDKLDKDFDDRLADLEKQIEELKERLVKAFKHQGFNF